MRECMTIDREYLNMLRNAYIAAKDEGKGPRDVITVDGREYVMQYLKYMIEYAEGQLNRKG